MASTMIAGDSYVSIELQRTLFNLTLCATGAFLCLYGAVSYMAKERIFLNEAPLAVVAGIALERLASLVYDGSAGWSIQSALEPAGTDLSRLVLGIQLVLLGIELPRRFAQQEARSLSVMLVPVMVTAWLVTAGLMMAVFPSLTFLSALVLAACVTPTDPILSNAIVKGSFADRHVSPWLRNLILGESGANDGLMFVLLYLPIRLLNVRVTTATALLQWLLTTCLYQVGGAALFGVLVGTSANRILRFSTKHNLIDTESFLCYGVATGIFVTGVAGFLDLDDLFAAFVAGNALTWDDWYRKETESDEIVNVVDLLLNSTFFLYVGATVPWKSFSSDAPHGYAAWHFVVLGIAVLALRRLPAMMLFHRLIPRLRSHRHEAIFMGYFGPIGAGAVFYSCTVLDEFTPDKDDERGTHESSAQIRALIRPTVYALVLASLVGHSGLIPFVEAFLSWRNKRRGVRLDGPDETPSAHRHDEDAEEAETGAGRGNTSSIVDPQEHSLLAEHQRPMRNRYDDDSRASWRLSTSHRPAYEDGSDD